MASISELLDRLGSTGNQGGTVASGVPYQNIPGMDIPCHRPNSDRRAERIMEFLDFKGKTVFDLGCSVGTMSGIFGKKAKTVIGIDYDSAAIDVARELYNSNVGFEQADLTLEFLDTFQRVEVAVWTSQFMWMAKQRGLEYALDFLWKLSTKADVLVFETAGKNDGSAPLDIIQEDIFKLLCMNTCYQEITDYGPWNDGWTPRNVFVCKNPFMGYQGEWSKVELVSRGIVRKVFESNAYAKELLSRELKFLSKLRGVSNFPHILTWDSNSITMKWAGIRAKWIPELEVQSILGWLQANKITHRDIRPDNLLFNGDNIVLVDFSFAVEKGEVTNYHYDLGGKYKCPNGFNDEYSLRKIQGDMIRA